MDHLPLASCTVAIAVAGALLLRRAKPGSRVRGNALVFCLLGLLGLATVGGPTALGGAAVAGQLGIMSSIVYRSSSSCLVRASRPLADVVRIVVGSLSACALQTVLMQQNKAIILAGSALCVWATCALSDYCFHRFIWHAHWARHPCGVFFQAIHNQYVQHFVSHHKHSLDSPTKTRMRALHPSPMSSAKQAEIERDMAADDVFALECSNHGFTVGTDRSLLHKWGCRWHTMMMYLAMPTGTAVMWNVLMGSYWWALLHLLAVSYPIYLTVHHDKYHSVPAKRKAWAAGRRSVLERWFWACEGMDTVTREHLQHHHRASGRERYFGLVPGGRLAIYPIWQTW